DLAKSHEHFTKAESLVREFNLNNRMFGKRDMLSIETDKCYLLLEKGQYSEAFEVITKAIPATLKAVDRTAMSAIVMYCELHVRLASASAAREKLELHDHFLTHHRFYAIEHTLLTARLNFIGNQPKVTRLQEILSQAKQIATLHQICRILLELSETTLNCGDSQLASQYITDALRIA